MKRYIVPIFAASLLGACATTTPSGASSANGDVRGVIDNLVTTIADQMEDRDPQFVADCQMSVAMSQEALRDQQTEDQNAVMNLQMLVWTDLKLRQEARGESAVAFLISDFGSDMLAEDIALKVSNKTTQCTRDFTEGMKAATAKLKADKAANGS